jgi:hypothetical protein
LAEDSATGVGVRTAAEREAEMAAEVVNNGKDNIDSSATSSTQTGEEHKTNKRYIPDNSIASMLGDNLVTFAGAFQADVAQAPPKPASPEEILAALNEISGLEDIFLADYDILVSNDRKFRSLVALPAKMKKKWILKQINT